MWDNHSPRLYHLKSIQNQITPMNIHLDRLILIFKNHEFKTTSLNLSISRFSPDGNCLASAGYDQRICKSFIELLGQKPVKMRN
jgi:WD40 repeat protein